MNLIMPTTFPLDDYQAYGKLASVFFHPYGSHESSSDPLERQHHFSMAWLAVQYRYRTCWECNEDFRAIIANAGELWKEWASDEEQNYKVETCLFRFYTSALSVFDTFGFCLYFVGNGVDSTHFLGVSEPRKITLNATKNEYSSAFPNTVLSNQLSVLLADPKFKEISAIRNIVAHRLTGRRTIRTYGGKREEHWYVPGVGDTITFDRDMVQRHFNEVTRLLTTTTSAALEFMRGIAPPA
jgi:hypothetical protein